ncbi:response regulator [Methylophaga sp. OBS1]|jgi:diguanylate cyclase (GGDEF)-like protein|uniref:response regulator n=1 Tax=Methylophaga sp. OBS1 TaxID=2991933 RepID=UPI00225C2A33|nr:response regulator [Methylophaga sp. OBS1]MCX4191413.1 response regulator [Methylophaga sp. OBS1]MCX4191641.1 response regulator [Methylophaga sp. OBS1]
MKVLIVDDAEIDSLICQKIVESLDYRPIAVSSASEALEILQKPGAPDIIVMDWFMPEVTGIALCEHIRSMHLMVEPFILMMTANTDRHAEAEALNAGADDFISKPVNRIDMEAKLRLGRRLIKTQLELLVANQKLQEKLQIDAVTGIMNRQSGLKAISSALSRLSRQKQKQGLLVHCHVRLSHEKHSSFMHEVHDKIYIQLAHQLAQILRQSDVVVRFRDDEFLFFAESDADSHQNLMQRIERAIMRDYPSEDEEGASSLIAGLVIRPEQAMTPVENLLQQTEIILSNLHADGKTAELISLPAQRNTRVVDFSDYRRAQGKL